MSDETLPLLIDEADGRLVLRCPGVGLWTAAPRPGSLLTSGDSAGVLETLGRSKRLTVPQGVAGRVTGARPERVHQPVSHGDALVELEPLDAVDVAGPDTSGHEGDAGPVLRAPYSGRFWHRPAPGDPAFVSAGDPVEAGTTVGLLEVMKTFTHLAYPEDGSLPSPARVVRILVEDGAEVGAGDPVLEVESPA